MFKQSMTTLSALAVLVALSGVSKADDNNSNDNTASEGYRQVTCAEATQAAWFAHEMERSDRDAAPDVALPAECNRELVVEAAAAAEESK